MATQVDGNTGVSQVQDNIVSTSKLQANSVTPAKTQVGALPSMVRLNTANGYGSTNTQIRRFTNVVTNQGSDISYVDSATLGATFTINANGVYAISYFDSFSTANPTWGISLNSSQLTTAVTSINAADKLAMAVQAAANIGQTVSTTLYLNAGDVIRAHGSAAATGGSIALFTIVRVA